MGRILVADDEDDIRLLIRILLARAGHEVIEACDGREAIEKAQEGAPDLILLDIRMPRMTGLEALDELRAAAATASIPAILVSAYAHDKDTREAAHARGIEFLSKPFQPADLLAAVRRVLG